jgi:hypothetical protein
VAETSSIKAANQFLAISAAAAPFIPSGSAIVTFASIMPKEPQSIATIAATAVAAPPFVPSAVSEPQPVFSAAHSMDIVYNIADAINKIGFGLVIYALSRNED